MREGRTQGAERGEWTSFDASLLDGAPDDSWIVVAQERRPQFSDSAGLPLRAWRGRAFGLPSPARPITATDLDQLARGSAGYLFPFVFHSRYVKLAELATRVDRSGPLPEQILLRLVEAGAETGALDSPTTEGSSSAPLSAELRGEVERAKHFLFEFSSTLPGVCRDRRPSRFSYKAFFWESDNGATLYKLYRHPDQQPRLLMERNPAIVGELPHVVRYGPASQYRSPSDTQHLVLSMQNFPHCRRLSDCSSQMISDRGLRRSALRAFSETWLAFLEEGLIPADLSLSNALLERDRRVVLVDMEEAQDVAEALAWGPIGPMMGLAAIIQTLVTGDGFGDLRFDEHRDRCFVPRWSHSAKAGRWSLAESKGVFAPELMEAFLNSRTPEELRFTSEELWNYADRAL